MSHVTIEGRLGRDIEVQWSQNGKAWARASVCQTKREERSGEWVETASNWWDVALFGKVAELAAEYLRKGDLVVVSGEVEPKQWEKDGEVRRGVQILARHIGKSVFGLAPKKGDRAPAGGFQATPDPWATGTAPGAEAPF